MPVASYKSLCLPQAEKVCIYGTFLQAFIFSSGASLWRFSIYNKSLQRVLKALGFYICVYLKMRLVLNYLAAANSVCAVRAVAALSVLSKIADFADSAFAADAAIAALNAYGA